MITFFRRDLQPEVLAEQVGCIVHVFISGATRISIDSSLRRQSRRWHIHTDTAFIGAAHEKSLRRE